MRIRLLFFPALVYVLFLALPDAIGAQEFEKDSPPTRAEWEEVVARTKRINAELAGGSNPAWAGSYHWGSLGFSGSVLYLAPKSGFAFRPYSDYDPGLQRSGRFDYGSVEEKDGIIYLVGERRKFGAAEKFHYVTWGDRSMLLSETYMPIFLNFVNAGCMHFQSKDKVGNLYFPTKSEQVQSKLFGRPALRKEFDALLLAGEISAKVLSVGSHRSERVFPDSKTNLWSRSYTNVTIDAGKSKGVWPGMRLFLGNMVLDIKTANESSAEGVITESFKEKELPPIMPGLTFWSSLKPAWFENEKTAPWDCA